MTVSELGNSPSKMEESPPPTPQQARLASIKSSSTNTTLPTLIMGTWMETYPGSKQYNALMGGRPLADWSGLDPAYVKTRK